LSIFQFLASDKPLKEVKDLYEGNLNEIEITKDMYYSSEYAKEYSNKTYFSQLKWEYTEPRAKSIIDYLKIELKKLDEIEIWSIWLGENIELDDHIWLSNNKWVDDDVWLDYRKPPGIDSISISELSIQDLEFLGKSYKPTCLIVNK